MTTPTSGAISIADLNSQFGYGNNLAAYKKMYHRNSLATVAMNTLYNKDPTKRWAGTTYWADDYIGGNIARLCYSVSPNSEANGCPWDARFTMGATFGWYSNSGSGIINSVVFGIYDAGFTTAPPQNYFTAFHLPGVIWLTSASATYSNPSATSARWVWGGYASNPLSTASSQTLYLEI